MNRPVAALLAVLIAGSAGAVRADYLSPIPGKAQNSWTFPLSPGGFIGGLDVVDSAGQAMVVFNEGGSIYNLNNGNPTSIYTHPSPSFASFVIGNPSDGRLVFSESLSYSVSSISTDGSAYQNLGAAPGSYDAVYGPDGKLYLTRAASFTGPTQIVVFDEATGTSTPVAEFSGPTGPIAFAADGSLYYGTVSPVFGQAGGQTLYRITPTQIGAVLGGGAVIQSVDAEVVVTDIDSPSDMLILPSGEVLYTSSVGSHGRIVSFSNGIVSTYATLQDPFLYMTNLAYYDGSIFVNVGGVYGPGFAPFGAIVQIVPEPTSAVSLALMAFGGIAAFRRRH